MDHWEREAAGFLALELTMANAAEFLEGIGKILDKYGRDLPSASEALRQIRRLREAMASSNTKLRELARDDQCPPSAAGGLFLPWTPL